jgi:alginate O-acetyltransferase complex protein AlgI
MLFCSIHFLVFFTVVFAVYWTLDRRAAKAAAFLLASAYLIYRVFHHLTLGHGADFFGTPVQGPPPHWPNVLDWQFGLALSVCIAVVQSRFLGVHQARVWLLLMVSFCFYASWNRWLALLILTTTFMDYVAARGMNATSSKPRRLALLLLSLAVNLGILVYLKYANFFLDSLEAALRAVGSEASLPLLEVILPIGISFYTFEAINYTVDVYRRRIPAERDLAHFMLFILFFPHLVAGPIVRAKDFLPQIRRRKRWDWMRLELGAQYFLMGLFKKLAIADRMAQFVDPVFADPTQYKTFAVWVAVLAYALQIYADFSGYTDMALGAAHALGYKLTLNFNMPYLAANVSEFWRRWHMSLSGWLRDYLFIPLGGSRGSRWQTNRNLLVTMTLGGLWHGASWTFVAWGVLHGLLLIGHRTFQDFIKPRPLADRLLQSPPGTAFRVGLTLLTVCLTWVFFRAQSFAGAAEILKRLFVPHDGLGAPLHDLGLWLTIGVVAACHAVGYSGLWKWLEPRLPDPVRGFAFASVLTATLVLAVTGQGFIYFQF